MYRILLALIALPLAAQLKQNGIELIPSTDNAAPGYLDFKALRPSAYRVRITGPTGLTSNVDLQWPATLPTANGQCIAGLVGGQLYFGSAACGERMVSDYNWSQTIGARSGSGAITLTFSDRCPFAGTDASGVVRVYESLVPTTYEFGIVTGGTCTRNGTGTLTVLGPTGTYTTAVATSASAGWQEAKFSVADGLPVKIRAKAGNYEIYSDILTEDRKVDIVCDAGAVLIPKTSGLKVFHVQSPSAIRINGCEIDNSTWLETAITGIYFNNPDGDTFGGRVENTTITSVENGIHGVTWYAIDAIGNLIINPTHAAIWVENVSTGDAGAGVLERNKLSCSATCDYGVLWNGPGAIEIKNNPINGFTEQIHLEPVHGYASAADSGANTVLTWVSGNRFRAAMVGTSVHVGTATCTVSTYTSSTSMTCNGVNLGSIGSSRYYAGTSGQAQVTGNLLDGAANTTHGVRWVGEISFTNAQIEDNFIANYTVNSAKGISLEGSGLAIAAVKLNNIQGAPALTGTIGIDATAGGQYHISGNQVSGYQTSFNVGSSVLYGTLGPNRCTNYGTTCYANAASTVQVIEPEPVTFANLPSAAADLSTLGCSDCKATSASVRTCTSGGSGALVTRIGGAWKCDDGTGSSNWTVTGSDIYRVSKVGIGAPPVVGTQLSISGGSGANTFYMTDSTAVNAFQINAASTYTFLGNYANLPLILGTDSVARWRITPAGMLQPETDDTYDLGLTGTRVRGVYAKFGEFLTAAGTSSSDYMSSRKFNLCNAAGGAGCWDMTATGSMAASSAITLRDNAGSRWLEGNRAFLGSPLNFTSVFSDWIPAKRATGSGDAVSDSAFPSLGAASAPWAKAYISELHADTLNQSLYPTPTNTYQIGGVSNRLASLYSVLGDFSGLITGSAGLTVSGGNATVEGIRFGTGSTYSVGVTGARALRVFTDGITTGGASYWESGADFVMRSGSTMTLEFGAPGAGKVLTSDAAGVATWQAAAGGQWTTTGSDVYYNSTGFVGIGVAPSAPLHIYNANAAIFMDGIGSAAPNLLMRSSNGTLASPTATASGDRIGQFAASGYGTSRVTSGRVKFVAGSTHSGSNAETALILSTTANGSTTVTDRHRVAANGDWLPEADNTYSYGSTGLRPTKIWTHALDAKGAVNFNSSTITASSTFSSDLIATTNATYALGSSGVRWLGYMSTLNVSSTFTFNGTLTGDWIPTTSNVYVNGSSSSYWNQVASESFYVENSGRIRPRTANTGSVGISSARFNKGWFTDMDLTGTITAPSGATYNGTTTCSAGQAVKTIVVSQGLITSITCAIP